jgi:hypothetical protein
MCFTGGFALAAAREGGQPVAGADRAAGVAEQRGDRHREPGVDQVVGEGQDRGGHPGQLGQEDDAGAGASDVDVVGLPGRAERGAGPAGQRVAHRLILAAATSSRRSRRRSPQPPRGDAADRPTGERDPTSGRFREILGTAVGIAELNARVNP